MKKFLFLVFFCVIAGTTFAQESSTNSKAFEMFFHAGWGILPPDFDGFFTQILIYQQYAKRSGHYIIFFKNWHPVSFNPAISLIPVHSNNLYGITLR